MTENTLRFTSLKLTGLVGGAFELVGSKVSEIMQGATQTGLPQIDGAWTYSGNVLKLDLAKLPEIGALGGAVRVEGDALPEPLLVVQGEDGNYYAFKNACAHAGRMIDPVAGTMTLQCSSVVCKDISIYDYQGRVRSGLAEGPLTSHRLSVEGNQITITL